MHWTFIRGLLARRYLLDYLIWGDQGPFGGQEHRYGYPP